MKVTTLFLSENNMFSIVLPAYKEKENLAVFIPQIEAEFSGEDFEVIVVDDHSMDGTRELVDDLQNKYQNISLLERPGLLGIGSALRDGYNLARGEYILSSDSDLSFSAGDMRRLYAKIQTGFDLVLGFKIAPGLTIADDSSDDMKQKAHTLQGWCENHIISPMSNWIIGLMSGVGLKNYNTNFRVIRSSTWKSFRTVEDRQFFLFETIIRAKQAGARIGEIPVVFSPRKFGESKVSFLKQAWGYFFKLIFMVYFDRQK
ncbi:glycosyltransferase [Candidatus Uhrbacteria bacterium]|nr:glycosyltransferase [Candidatus Uhrbacteria bacterium]